MSKRAVKILIAGVENPKVVQAWSGIPYHLGLALRRRFQVSTFGGGRRHVRLIPFYVWERLADYRYKGRFRIRAEPSFLKTFASLLDRAIQREKPDLVLSIVGEPIAYLPPGVPTVMVHDATFRLLRDYYPKMTNLCERTLRYAEEGHQRSLDRVDLALLASEWARQSTCRDYRFPAERAHVLPMGANLSDPPGYSEIMEAIDQRLTSHEVNFLLAGVDWVRKGGDTAVRIVEQLIQRGVKARLHIAGCNPPPSALARPFLVNHGFLDKSDPTQAAQLRHLFKTASFFILPSVAECYGCVFCEASAFGLPSISRDTGGISSAIHEGVNGYLLSSQLNEESMVSLIDELLQDKDRYRQLALSSRREFETRLNWDTYAEKVEQLVAPLL